MSSGPLVDAVAQETAKRGEELERHQRTTDLREVMGTQAGRRLVWRLLDVGSTGLHAASYTGEALSSAYAEGRRAIGIELMREVQGVAPLEYLAMMNEAMQRFARKAAEK